MTAKPPATAKPATAHRFIVLEGPIGVGKSTLAKKLAASLEAELVLEQAAA